MSKPDGGRERMQTSHLIAQRSRTSRTLHHPLHSRAPTSQSRLCYAVGLSSLAYQGSFVVSMVPIVM